MTPRFEIFSTITCSFCGHKQKYQMPVYAKRTYYECPQCRFVYRTKKEDCCIYCAYGDVMCPDKQAPPPAASDSENLSEWW